MLVLTHSNLSVCLSTVPYPSTADWKSLYHALLNTSLSLIQVSLSNSLFSLKSAYFEYVPTLDPILPRSTHDCFAWIDNFNPVLLQNNLYYFSSLYLVYLLSKLSTLMKIQLPSFQLHLHSSMSYLCRYSSILW
jgi:hypothetical protein